VLEFLLILLFQGGSPEPPSAHSLRPAQSLGSEQAGGLAGAEEALVELYARNLPSLVQVRLGGEASDGLGNAPAGSELVLSGVVLGETATGSLVLVPGKWNEEQAAGLVVYDMGGRRYPVQALAVDEALGLSLLSVDELLVEAPAFGFAETLPIGSTVALLGNGYGMFGSVSVGILAGRNRQLDDLRGLLQISNPVNPGDGGGLLLDRRGRLIGIALTSLEDAMRRKAAHDSVAARIVRGGPTGVAFALPLSPVLRAFSKQLSLAADEPRPILGVQVQEAAIPRDMRRKLGLEQRTALLVVRVEPGLPADRAGLKPGDYLLALSGQPVRSFTCLFNWLRGANGVCPALYLRGDQLVTVDIPVERSAVDPSQASRGGFRTQASPALIDDKD
jgi:S1-C subfamily serine protease